MKLLHIDLETSPNIAHVWGLFQQNVSLNQLMQSTEMLSFAAKWHGTKRTMFYSSFHDGQEAMVQRAWELLDEADVVCHFNGRRFDVPHLNREFKQAGFNPPAPYKQIDLLQTVRRQFKLPSNKLQYVSKWLGLAGKVQHSGHDLWVRCMAGDAKAWAEMRRYNKQDVDLLEDCYNELLPWISNHPAVGLFSDRDDTIDRCPKCDSTVLVRQGYAHTSVAKFQRFKCGDCGSWSRSGKAVARIDVRQVAG